MNTNKKYIKSQANNMLDRSKVEAPKDLLPYYFALYGLAYVPSWGISQIMGLGITWKDGWIYHGTSKRAVSASIHRNSNHLPSDSRRNGVGKIQELHEARVPL